MPLWPMLEKLISRKFGVILFVIWMAAKGEIPQESHELVWKLSGIYVGCETLVDIAKAIFGGKAVGHAKHDKPASA